MPNPLARCRDPAIWLAAAKATYEGLQLFSQYPRKLQTIGFPTQTTVAENAIDSQVNTVLLGFLTKVESFLQTNATTLNYTSLWDQTKPDPSLPPLSIFLNRTYPTLISKEQTKNVRDPFYADYAAAHDGRLPFVDPVPLVSGNGLSFIPAVAFSFTHRCCTSRLVGSSVILSQQVSAMWQ